MYQETVKILNKTGLHTRPGKDFVQRAKKFEASIFVEKSKQDAARHPDEVGRVIRKFEDYIVVAVKEGSLYIKELFWKKQNIVRKIKSGDKFFTKIKYLDLKNRRGSFIDNSNKIYNYKTKLIKR